MSGGTMLPCSLVGNFGRDVPTLTKNAATLRNPAVSDPPPPEAKTISTLAAKFAIAGRELHVIHEGDRTYFRSPPLGPVPHVLHAARPWRLPGAHRGHCVNYFEHGALAVLHAAIEACRTPPPGTAA